MITCQRGEGASCHDRFFHIKYEKKNDRGKFCPSAILVAQTF